MKRRWVVIGISTGLLVVLLWSMWVFWPRPRVVDKIQPGMTLPEVAAAVGRPPDSGMPSELDPSGHGCLWVEADYSFVVVFEDGRATHVAIGEQPIRKRLGLQFGR